jgi:hypothetical protein
MDLTPHHACSRSFLSERKLACVRYDKWGFKTAKGNVNKDLLPTLWNEQLWRKKWRGDSERTYQETNSDERDWGVMAAGDILHSMYLL